MATRARSVKKLGISLLGILALCTAAIAPSAFAGDTILMDKTVSVKFRLTELQAENGKQSVYSRLKKRAKSYCKADRGSLYYLGQSVKECTDDLLEQFIQNANVAELKAYHLSQKLSG